MKRSLSGIKPTGQPHLGNYLGMIQPAIELQKTHETFYFVADYHALTSVKEAKKLRQDSFELAAAFLACGLDISQGAFFRQSDIPELGELTWLLSCNVSVGDLTRAHAYKAAKDQGKEGELNLGVFSYPVLMSADILCYDSDLVPVGRDQIQHIEMCRAIAKRFNHYYGDCLKEPQELVQENVAVIPGTDGRKMSKSYHNGIEPFASKKLLKKQVMNIVTDSKELEDKKDPETCHIFQLYKFFSTEKEQSQMAEQYRSGGFGYGHAKIALLEKIENHFSGPRERYGYYLNNPQEVESILAEGATKARKIAQSVLERCRKACGLQ